MNFFRKVTAIFIAVVIVLSMTLCTVSAEETKRYGIVTASLLNLRKAPNTNSQILAQIPNGTSVNIIKLEGNWANVNYYGSTGYLSLDYLKVMTGEAPSRSNAVSSKGQAIVELAKKYIGTPYRYGGASPSGFNCSGFV